jgi:hypothetical protein
MRPCMDIRSTARAGLNQLLWEIVTTPRRGRQRLRPTVEVTLHKTIPSRVDDGALPWAFTKKTLCRRGVVFTQLLAAAIRNDSYGDSAAARRRREALTRFPRGARGSCRRAQIL